MNANQGANKYVPDADDESLLDEKDRFEELYEDTKPLIIP